MSVPKTLRRKAISIDRYMELELPVSRIEGAGWLVDSQLVLLVDSTNLILYASVARAEDGYHYGVNYNTSTGGVHCAAYMSSPAAGKLEALKAVIRSAMDNDWVTGGAGNMSAMKAALKELKKYEYQQLTLF